MVEEATVSQPRKLALFWKILFAALTLAATVTELLDGCSFLSSLWVVKHVGLGLAAVGFFLLEKRVGWVFCTVGFAVFSGVHFFLALAQFVAIPITISSMGRGVDETFAWFTVGEYAECVYLLLIAVASLLCATGVSKPSKEKKKAAMILSCVAVTFVAAAWLLLRAYHISYLENYVGGDSAWGFFGGQNEIAFRMIAYLVWSFCVVLANFTLLRERKESKAGE